MNDSQQLREQMWDLVYGLLTPTETESLIARIKSDPQAARLYAEVRLQSDLVGFAAKVEDPSLVFEVESRILEKPTPARRPAALAPSAVGSRSGRWLLGIAASALAALLAVGICWPQPNAQQIAANNVALDVSGPQSLQAGITNKISIKTYTVGFHGGAAADFEPQGQPADVEVSLVDAGRNVRFHKQVRTSAVGWADVELPGHAIEPGVHLEVASKQRASKQLTTEIDEATKLATDGFEGKRSLEEEGSARGENLAQLRWYRAEADLSVQPEPVVSFTFLESPVAKAGDTIRFSTLNYKPFSGEAVPAEVSEITVDNAEGVMVAKSDWMFDDDRLGVKGTLQLPPDAAVENLNLVVRESNGYESQTPLSGLLADSKSLSYRRNLAALSTANGDLRAKALDELRLRQYSEKLAKQKAPATGGEADKRLPAEQKQDRATEGLTQKEQLDKSYYRQNQGLDRLQAAKDAGADGSGLARGLRTDGAQPLPVVAAGQPVQLPIPADQSDNRQLYAIANSRGVNVASEAVIADPQPAKGEGDRWAKEGPTTYSFALPPEVDGEFEVALVDRSKAPPQVVERRRLYREPARRLNIDVAETKAKFAPGERVQLTLQVNDESGQPVAGTDVVVRLWNEQLVQQTAATPATLDDAVRGRIQENQAAEAAPDVRAVASAPAPTGAPGSADKNFADRPALPMPELAKSKTQEGETLAAVADSQRSSGGLQPDFYQYGLSFSPPVPTDDYLALAPTETVTLASTRQQVEADNATALEAAQERRRAIVRTVSGVALGGGVALLLVASLLAVRRVPARGKLLFPVLAVAAASLIVCVVWIGRLPQGRQQVALAPTTGEALRTEGEVSRDLETTNALALPAGDEAPRPEAKGIDFGRYALPADGTASGPKPLPEMLGSVRPPAAIAPPPTPEGPDANAFAAAPAPVSAPAAASETARTSSAGGALRPQATVTRAPLPPAPGAPLPPAPGAPLPPAPGAPSPAAPVAAAPAAGSGPENADAARKLAMGETPAGPQAGQSQLGGGKGGVELPAPATAPLAKAEANKPADALGFKKSGDDKDTAAANTPAGGAVADNRAFRGQAGPAPGGFGAQPGVSQPRGGAAPMAGEEGFSLERRSAAIDGGNRGGAAGAPGPATSRAGGFGGGGGGLGGPAGGGLGGGRGMRPVAPTNPTGEVQAQAGGGYAPAPAAGTANSGAAPAPPALYFNPQLVTDANGRVTFEFTMPAGETEYRLLVDALGKGRLGSKQQIIVGSSAANAGAPAEAKPAGAK